MRHAQYRLELADWIGAAVARPVAVERPDPNVTPPVLTVVWTGTQLDRRSGWLHSYEVEIRVGERNTALDVIVQTVAVAVAAWRPNVSAAPSAPTVRPIDVFSGDIQYPAVIVSTVVTEPTATPN